MFTTLVYRGTYKFLPQQPRHLSSEDDARAGAVRALVEPRQLGQLAVAPAVRALVEPRQLGQLVVAPFVDHPAEEGVRYVVVGRRALGGDRILGRLGREGRLAEGDKAVEEVVDGGHLLRARWDRARRRCARGVAADVLLVRLDGLRLGKVEVRRGRLVVEEVEVALVVAFGHWARAAVCVLGRGLPRLDAVRAALREGGNDVNLPGLIVDVDLRGRLIVAVGVALREVGVAIDLGRAVVVYIVQEGVVRQGGPLRVGVAVVRDEHVVVQLEGVGVVMGLLVVALVLEAPRTVI